MLIEEYITINASPDKVWRIFSDLSCWKDWSRIITDAGGEGGGMLLPGKSFSFCVRPFMLPVNIEPVVDVVEPGRRIVWTGTKLGVTARHEYIFERSGNGVKVVSRERFDGLRITLLAFMATRWRLKQLSADVLAELKAAAERPD